MPIYEYRCGSCGAELEKIQKMSDPVLTLCPECGEERLVKLVSASGFRLSGSGWYETDFKKSGTKRNLATDSGSSGTESGSSGKQGSSSAAASTGKGDSKNTGSGGSSSGGSTGGSSGASAA